METEYEDDDEYEYPCDHGMFDDEACDDCERWFAEHPDANGDEEEDETDSTS